MPYVTSSFNKADFLKTPVHANSFDYNNNVGLDAKIGITNNLTFDLTVNPDFGQVEADPAELNLSAFESYFREKRPFFVMAFRTVDRFLGHVAVKTLYDLLLFLG